MILLQILESVVLLSSMTILVNNARKIHLTTKLNTYTSNAVDIIRNYKGYYSIYVAEMSSESPNKTILWEIINKRLFVDDIANKIPEARIVSDICRRSMRNVFVTFRLVDGSDSNMIDLYVSHNEDMNNRLIDAINMLGFDVDDIQAYTIYEKHKSTQTFSIDILRELYNKKYHY